MLVELYNILLTHTHTYTYLPAYNIPRQHGMSMA